MRYIFFALLLSINFIYAAAPPPAEGKNAMVVSAHPLATKVGLDILRQGGNAVDAAVAMGYALAVVDPCCGNLGGGGFMLVHLAQGKNVFINFREKAPLQIRITDYFSHGKPDPNKIQQGYLAVGVPGTVKGLNLALAQYGTLKLSQAMQPAIKLAEQGFILNQGDIQMFAKLDPIFAQQKNIAKIFKPDGETLKVGQLLKQNTLARTLKLIAQTNGSAFYHGAISAAVVAASKENGGVLTSEDFNSYRAQILNPILCHYHGYTIITSPPPSSGGVTLCEMLKILSAYPLKEMGFHSAKSAHYLIEAMRFAYADRNRNLGDPDFIHNPIQQILSDEHIQKIQSHIQTDRAGKSKQPSMQKTLEKMQTTSYAVVDSQGNAVSVTYTLNGFFGAKIIAQDTGFFLNNEMDDFTLEPGVPNMFGLIQGKANLVAPGKRPLSSMTPTFVMKDNQIYLILGAAGGSTIITQILQQIINVIDYQMNISQAIAAPRIHMQWLPDRVFLEVFALSPDTMNILKRMGYQFQSGFIGEDYWGFSAGIQKPKPQKIWGAADVRYLNGSAAGY